MRSSSRGIHLSTNGENPWRLIVPRPYNIWSLKELLRFYGDKLIPPGPADPPEVPLVVLANKRDLEDIVEVPKIRQVLDTAKLQHTLIYETIAITGINVKRAFVYAARQAVLNHYKKLSGKGMESA